MRRAFLIITSVVALTVLLSACGRRGPLEPPPDAPPPAQRGMLATQAVA